MRAGLHGAALAIGTGGDAATDVVAVDTVADEAAGNRTGCSRGLPAVAATDLVAEQATDHGTRHGTSDIAVTFRQALLYDDVIADLARGRRGAGLAHRLGADYGRVQGLLLVDRLDVENVGVLDATDLLAIDGAIGSQIASQAGGERAVGPGSVGGLLCVIATEAVVGGNGDAANEQRSQGYGENILVHWGLLLAGICPRWLGHCHSNTASLNASRFFNIKLSPP